jgi:septum site-determining protein MinC
MSKSTPAAAEIRSASLTLVTLVLQTADLGELQAFLARKAGPGLFEDEPVLVDVSALLPSSFDLIGLNARGLKEVLRDHGMVLTAIKVASDEQRAWAQDHKLPIVTDGMGTVAAARPAAAPETPSTEVAPQAPAPVAAAAPSSAPAPATVAPPVAAPAPRAAMVIDKPLRSGQQVYARGSDLVVMAAVNFGAEVIADGHIHVYAPLRGRAIAGAKGDENARIFAVSMEPQLIAIAGTYRTLDTSELPADVRGKPAQVRMEGDRLVIEPIAG